jgi:zinc transporter ZupT
LDHNWDQARRIVMKVWMGKTAEPKARPEASLLHSRAKVADNSMKFSGLSLAWLSALCVCTGLALVRRLPRSPRERGLFTMGAAGLALFLVIEVGYQALGTVELVALSNAPGALVLSTVLLVIGLLFGMVGLAWIETRRGQPAAYDPRPLDVAMMLAAGVGLYSFGKGLSVGQTAAALEGPGMLVVLGVALQGLIGGAVVAAPVVGQPMPLGRLLLLATIVAGPSVGGIIVGTNWVGPGLELLVLSLAAGTLIYVLRELLRGRLENVSAVGAMWGLAVGLLLALAAELLVELGRQV